MWLDNYLIYAYAVSSMCFAWIFVKGMRFERFWRRFLAALSAIVLWPILAPFVLIDDIKFTIELRNLLQLKNDQNQSENESQ